MATWAGVLIDKSLDGWRWKGVGPLYICVKKLGDSSPNTFDDERCSAFAFDIEECIASFVYMNTVSVESWPERV